MNILEAEDIIKGLPDNALFEEAQMPSGQVPQFLVVSEIQRRSDMRKRYQEQQPNKGTVKDQIVQQGIMGMAPPATGGMPPQALPQQGMPPQQMFGGGIIRLQEGGFLDQMTVAPELSGRDGPVSVRSQIELALAQGATMADLLSIFRNQPEAIELVKQLVADRQRASVSQYNPLFDEGVSDLDKALIASDRAKDVVADQIGSRFNHFQPPEIVGDMVEGAVNAYRSIPSMDDLVSSFRDMAPERGQEVPDLAGRYSEQLASIKGQLPSLPSGTNFLSSIAEGMRQTPLGEYSRAAEQGIMDVYERDGLAAAIGETGRAGLGGLIPLGKTVAEGYEPAVKALVGAADYLTSGPAEVLDQFFTGSIEDPLTLGDIFGGEEPYPLREVTVDAKGREISPEIKALLEAAQASTEDASNPATGDKSGAKNRQGTSARQRQALPPPPDAPPPPGEVDALDFSDLIKESKDAAMANALMQLGAGIAGGDLSKGISAAGLAAAKGQQDAKTIAIQQRLAEYQAGREDQARERKAYEFDTLLAQAERKIGAELQKAERVSKGQLISFVSDIVKEAAPDFLEEGQSRQAVIEALTQQLLMKYAPFLDVDVSGIEMGMPTATAPSQSQSGWGIARP